MDLCFVDTETTSLSAEDGEIWEFAGIRRTYKDPEHQKLGFNQRRLEFQIECDLGKADPFSLKIGRYRERFGVKGDWETFSVPGDDAPLTDAYDTNPEGRVVTSKFDAARLIERFTRNTTLVGNCVSFDSERMERLLRAYNECPGWYYHIIDIEPMIVGYAIAKGVPFSLPYSSSDLTKWLGVEEPSEAERHTAMGDAEWVMRQWDALHGF